MTTYGTLNARALRFADDSGAAIWSDTVIFEFLGAATEDYAIHIPPRFTTDVTTTADVRVYSLAGDRPRGVYSVEYPQGEDPPEYLTYRPFQHPNFWQEDGYYDFIDWADEVAGEKQLYISTKPGASETIRVHWTGRYNISDPPETADSVPVPQQHHHILLKYVFWQMLLHQLGQETGAPSGSATVEIMRQLSTNAERAEQTYRRAIRDAQNQMTNTGPAASPWRIDKWDQKRE